MVRVYPERYSIVPKGGLKSGCSLTFAACFPVLKRLLLCSSRPLLFAEYRWCCCMHCCTTAEWGRRVEPHLTLFELAWGLSWLASQGQWIFVSVLSCPMLRLELKLFAWFDKKLLVKISDNLYKLGFLLIQVESRESYLHNCWTISCLNLKFIFVNLIVYTYWLSVALLRFVE